MKNIKIIITLISLIILSSCGNDENSELPENTQNITINEEIIEEENVNKIENEVYNEIVDEKTGLQNATSDDLDKILQEEIRILNTPISEYPFFEQSSTKKANIEEIKKAGGLEITRGNIYIHGINNKYSFFNTILNDNEKLYSFSQNENTFFYLDRDINKFLGKVKTQFTNYKVNVNGKEYKEITFINEGKKYSLQIFISKFQDDIDNILEINEKIKVTIIQKNK